MGLFTDVNDPDFPRAVLKKIDKAMADSWPSQDLSKVLLKQGSFDYLYLVKAGDQKLGYLLIDQAPSRDSQFDYLLIIDNEMVIQNAQILIYREDYGGEIGSNRWLKQFKGASVETKLELNQDIAGISGATVSCRSATKAFKNSLMTLKSLKENGKI